MEIDNNHPIVEDIVNTEDTSTHVNLVEEMVGEVIVPSSSHTEDIISLGNSVVTNSIEMCANIVNEGPSTSETVSNNRLSSRRLTDVIHVITQNVSRGSGPNRVDRHYVNLKFEIMKRKLNILKLKREGLVKQFDIKMRLLKTRLNFEKKKLHVFRKKYRC